MGKIIKAKEGGRIESKVIEEYTPLINGQFYLSGTILPHNFMTTTVIRMTESQHTPNTNITNI